MAGEHQSAEGALPSASLVEYCLRNVPSGSRTALAESDLRTEGTACLGRCGDCFAEPFLVVDGEYVHGSHEELINALGGNK